MDSTPAAAWRFEIVDRVGSTNDALIARVAAGEAGHVALLARRQEAARGSRGRLWQEPPIGNLALSVLLRPFDQPPSTTVFAASLALRDALGFVPAPFRLVLKWPNDVMLIGPDSRSGKVAGILVETARAGTGLADWAVIGFGVNLLAAPPIEGARAIGEAVTELMSADQVAHTLLRQLDHWFAIADTDGFAPIREAWLAAAHPFGTELAVESGGVRRRGRFAGLDGSGALLLRVGATTERISTGRVLLGNWETV